MPALALAITQQSLARFSPVTQVLFFKTCDSQHPTLDKHFPWAPACHVVLIFLISNKRVYHVWPLGHIGRCENILKKCKERLEHSK